MDPAPPPNPAIAELLDILGMEDTRELVRTYLREFDGTIRALATGARESQHRVAHAFKSSARHMGALTLSHRLAALELRLQQPDGTVTPEDLRAITEDFERGAGPLRAFVAGK